MADIFISYSKEHPQPTHKVADYLKSKGYSVWWDTDLVPGENFRKVINRELNAAKAVIVIWTRHSVTSEWVISEAEHAARQKKLIPLRTKALDTWRIPKPYDTRHTAFIDDRAAILAAVRYFGAAPAHAATSVEPQHTTLVLPAIYWSFNDPIYVAGSFNNWLNAESGQPRVSVGMLTKYRLKTVGSRALKSRQLTLSLPPGKYEFKFVTGKFEWLPWVVESEHERGQDAPDGPNFRIKVG